MMLESKFPLLFKWNPWYTIQHRCFTWTVKWVQNSQKKKKLDWCGCKWISLQERVWLDLNEFLSCLCSCKWHGIAAWYQEYLLPSFSCFPNLNCAIYRGAYHAVVSWMVTHTCYLPKTATKTIDCQVWIPSKSL